VYLNFKGESLKKRIILVLLGVSISLYSAEVGDKIKFVMPTVMCDNKVQMAAVYQLQMVMSDDLNTFKTKFNSKNNDGCKASNTGRSQNMFGTIIKKGKGYLSKELTGAKIDLTYEHLKIEFTSIGRKDVSGSGAYWFASFDVGPIYEIIK